jgi:uncharacterized membrane protein YoaK (UPF0700 family)
LRSSWIHGADSQSIPLWMICALLSILAVAMGLQTATLTRIGPLTIHTTFVTGMLNKLAQAVSQSVFWIHDRWKEHAGFLEIVLGSRQQPAFRNARFMCAIWVMYMFGSVAGTWMHARWSVSALYLPVFILLISAAIDQLQPLSIEEEREQS